ncbi:AH receptor-interacting protein-like [Mercenaria mercenaria]|uniref:AH receptor-interacting protein-like n=1 Tax=Mercenaria mercenaria TaxID=6596 RepID=UPI00234E8167|nr:AH receptor-interacting protein-like [Mercenaria mercenaria]
MADYFAILAKLGIQKKILHGGKGDAPDYEDGTKLYFHYKTCKCDDEHTIIDDSHNHEKPMELILGKKFKFEVWEACLKSMRVEEVSEFTVDTKLVEQYPLVSKQLREIFGKHKKKHEEEKSHCCGMMAMSEKGLGHPDLDDLVKNPQPLAFTIDLIKIERPGSYEKESWTLTDEEKQDKVPKLKEAGNELYKQKKYSEAAEKYGEAIGLLEQLCMKEKPGDPDWHVLEDMKIPLLLNFSQCKLLLKEYYIVIEHTSTVLKRDPDNVKALFRRGKAHIGAWNPREARIDFERVAELDSTLSNTVKKELKYLEELQKKKDLQDKEKLKSMFAESSS